MTPIYSVSLEGHLDVVKLLFEQGADVEVTHKNGWTAASTAAERDHLEIVKFLVKNGSDIRVITTRGSMALSSGNTAVGERCRHQ
jgi:ankyrin repeat protein